MSIIENIRQCLFYMSCCITLKQNSLFDFLKSVCLLCKLYEMAPYLLQSVPMHAHTYTHTNQTILCKTSTIMVITDFLVAYIFAMNMVILCSDLCQCSEGALKLWETYYTHRRGVCSHTSKTNSLILKKNTSLHCNCSNTLK